MSRKKVFSRGFILLLLLYLLLPLGVTIVYSFFQKWTGVLPQRFSIQEYIVLLQDKQFLQTIARTVFLALLPILITAIVTLLALFVTTVYFPKLEKFIQLLCLLPYMIQGVILSVSIISLYGAAPSLFGNRIFLLIGAYCITILPHMYQGIHNAMSGTDLLTLLEAVEMLGASKFYGFIHVVIPQLIPGILISSLLSMGILFGDYVIIRNITGTAFSNMQVYLFQTMKLSSTQASAIFVIMMLITAILTLSAMGLQKQMGQRQSKGADKNELS